MANNATTTWRWAGETSNVWAASNWLNAAGVTVDDWPTGALATHTVKFLGADLAGSRCAVGPVAPVALLKIECDKAYSAEGDPIPVICFADVTVGTVNAITDYTDPSDDSYVTIAGGTVTTANCYGKSRIQGGTITTANMYDAATLEGGTIASKAVMRAGTPYINVATGLTLTFSEGATIDVMTDGIVIGTAAAATGLSFAVKDADTDPTTIRFMRREATVEMGALTITQGTLRIDSARAYGFGGRGRFP